MELGVSAVAGWMQMLVSFFRGDGVVTKVRLIIEVLTFSMISLATKRPASGHGQRNSVLK